MTNKNANWNSANINAKREKPTNSTKQTHILNTNHNDHTKQCESERQ